MHCGCALWQLHELASCWASADADADAAKIADGMIEALQRALVLQRQQMVELLLELPTARVAALQIVQLYSSHAVKDPYRVLQSDRGLQARLADGRLARMELLHERADRTSTSREQLQHQMYCAVAGPLLDALCPPSTSLHAHALLARRVRMADLFWWAVVTSREELAFTLWPRCEKPLHCAILGYSISSAMADRVNLSRAEINERADRMGLWAVHALQLAKDESLAYHVLDLSLLPEPLATSAVTRRGPRQSLLDLAMCAGYRPLLSLTHAEQLVDIWWRGGAVHGDTGNMTVCVLPEKFSWFVTLLHFLLPFLHPDLHLMTAVGKAVARVCRKIGCDWVVDRVVSLRSGRRMRGGNLRYGTHSAFASTTNAIGSTIEFVQISMREWRQATVDAVHSAPASSPESGGGPPPPPPLLRRNGLTKEDVTAQVHNLSKNIDTFQAQLSAQNAEKEAERLRLLAAQTVTVGRFYTAPAVQFLARFISSFCLAVLCFVVNIQYDHEKGFEGVDYAWCVFQVAFLLDDIHQHVVARRQLGFSLLAEGSLWIALRALAGCFFLVTVIMQVRQRPVLLSPPSTPPLSSHPLLSLYSLTLSRRSPSPRRLPVRPGTCLRAMLPTRSRPLKA